MKIPSLTAVALATTLLLGACGGDTSPPITPDATQAIDPVRISGTVTGAALPPGDVYLVTDDSASIANMGRVVGTALTLTLDTRPEDGSFFTLIPGAGSSCVYSGPVPANASPRVSLWTDLLTTGAGADPLGLITESVTQGGSTQGSSVARMYSDRAATVAGTVTCDPAVPPFSFDMNLQAGWNALELSQSATSTRLTNLAASARRTLVARSFTPGVGVVLEQGSLMFTTDTATTSATFFQIGGYNGAVTLSTDVPGLTVEPMTVTLPALRTLATHPSSWGFSKRQRVDVPLTFRYTGTATQTTPFTLTAKDAAGATVGSTKGTIAFNRPGLSLHSMSYQPRLAARETVKVSVCANSVGGFSGAVTFGAKNLPAGVTVTPVTATVTGSACVDVPLTAASTVRSGNYPITLTASSGSVSAEVGLDLTVLGPSVSVAFVSSTVPVYVGTGGTATVDVSSQYGFAGPTTVTLTGLPAGVTTTPTTVDITAGAVTRVNLPLSVAADAPLGNLQIRASSPDLGPDPYHSNSATLSVRPERVNIANGYATVAATSGVWQITQNNYDTSTIALTGTTGTTRTVNLPHAVSRLVSVSGGVVAFTINGTNAASLVTDAGKITTLPKAPFTDDAVLAETTDSQGRLWYTTRVYNTNGTSIISLRIWTPTTGAVRIVDTTNLTGSGWLAMGPDGAHAAYGIAGSTAILKYRTDTLAMTRVTVNSSFSNLAVTASGQLWLSNYGQSLTRVNADGSSTIFNVMTGTLIGFDQRSPSVLWGRDDGAAYRIDTTSATVSSVPLSNGQLVAAVTAPSGGLYVVTRDYQLSGSDLSYLSILK